MHGQTSGEHAPRAFKNKDADALRKAWMNMMAAWSAGPRQACLTIRDTEGVVQHTFP